MIDSVINQRVGTTFVASDEGALGTRKRVEKRHDTRGGGRGRERPLD